MWKGTSDKTGGKKWFDKIRECILYDSVITHQSTGVIEAERFSSSLGCSCSIKIFFCTTRCHFIPFHPLSLSLSLLHLAIGTGWGEICYMVVLLVVVVVKLLTGTTLLFTHSHSDSFPSSSSPLWAYVVHFVKRWHTSHNISFYNLFHVMPVASVVLSVCVPCTNYI